MNKINAKRRSKGKGGSSGGANPKNDGRITDEQHEDAMRILRAEYYQGVRGIAEELAQRVKDGDIKDQDGWERALHETVDGSYWVIYTHANFQVLMCSDHHDAYSEDYGEPPVTGSDINWAALAYATLNRDVQETAEAPNFEELEEAPRRGRSGSGWWIHWSDTVPEGPFPTKADAERWYRAERSRGRQPATILPSEHAEEPNFEEARVEETRPRMGESRRRRRR